MKTKTIIILLCLITQVLQSNGLIQLKNSLAHSDSPLLKKILELVDAAINDEHLLQVTLKLLRSLCTCMRETLKAKEVNLNVGKHPIDLNESSGTDGKVFELYKNIYNNTCFNLRQDLTNRTHKFIGDEEAEFLNHTNCGKDEKNETIDERDDNDKSPAVKHLTTSRLEQVLFKALIQTKYLHEYRLRTYNLFGKGRPQLKKALQNILIVILTLYPDKQELSSRRNNIDEKDLNNTIYTKSPIDVDIISTVHDQKRKGQAIKAQILSECNLQSLYTYLTESDRNNQIKVFKLIRKHDTIKIYTEVKVRQNHTDLINICCKNRTTIPQCNREIMNDFMTQPKLIDENYKNTITKIRSLVNQYEHKLNDTTHHNISTTNQDEKKEEILITEFTTKLSTNTDRINDNENDIQVSDTNSKESSKLDEVTQAIVLLNDFVSKQTTKTYSQTHQTDRTESFKPWTEFMLKGEIQQDVTTPYNSINIGTALDVKGEEEKSHHTSISSQPFFENNKDAINKNYAPKNVVKTKTKFKEYETSNKQEKQSVSQEKHETEEELRQASTSRSKVLYMVNKPYTIDSSSINNAVNTDMYTIDDLQSSIIANQVNNTVAPTLNYTDKLSEFTTPQLITGKTLIHDLGINQNDYETYLLGQHIIKVSDSSSTTISSTEQSTETTLHYSLDLNLVNLANNATLSTFVSTLTSIFNNSLFGGEQILNDAQNISKTSILVNSTDVTKSIAESEPMNETFATEESKASVSNVKPNVTSTEELTENVNEIGQSFTLGAILDDVVKSKPTKTFTSDSLAIKNISETSIKSTFQNIAPNTTFKPVTTPESYKQSVPGHKEDIVTIDIVTKTEPTSTIVFYVKVEKPNENKGTKTVTPESLETNKISKTTMTTTFQNVAINTKPESLTTLDATEKPFLDEETIMKPTFKDIATNTTIESLTRLSTLDFIKSYNESGNSDMEGIHITDKVTKAETMKPFAYHLMNDAPAEQAETKTLKSEYFETNNISETTMTTITNTTLELLTKLAMLDFTKNQSVTSQNQSAIDDVEGINITDTVSKAESTNPFASHIMIDAPHEQTETKTFTSESLEINNISETTTTIQNVETKTEPELLTTVNFTKSQNQLFLYDLGGTNITHSVRVTKAKPMVLTIDSHVKVDELNEQTETKTFTLESLGTNTTSKTTIKTKFQDTVTNTTLESLTAHSTSDSTKSHRQSIYNDIEAIETNDIVTKAEPMSTFASHITVETLNEQTKTKTFTSESPETSNISETTVKTIFWNVTINTKPQSLTTLDEMDQSFLDEETTMKPKFKDIATYTTLESLAALATIDSTKLHKQSIYDVNEGIETNDIVTKAQPMSTFASHIMVETPNEQTKTKISTSESPETSNISETTVKTIFWNVTTNTTLELLTKLSTLGFTKSHNQSIHDDIEGINTIDRITKSEPLSTFTSDVSTLDDVRQAETKTFTSESPETNNILETTFQNISTNMTLEPFTSLPILDSTKSDNQAVYDDIKGIDTATKAELMSTFGSHVTIEEPINHNGQKLLTNFTKNSIIKISTTETTFSKSTEDLNNTYNGMNFDMLDDFFKEGEPNNYTNAGTDTNEYKTNEQRYMTTGLPVNTEENTVITKDLDNEITIKSTDTLTSEVEFQITTEFYIEGSNKVNSTFPDTILTNLGTHTSTKSYMTTALSEDTEETIVNTQDSVPTLSKNETDNEITMKSTDTQTPEQELRMTTEFNTEEPKKLNGTIPGIISNQSVPSTETIPQSEIVSTYTANPPKSRDTIGKQLNQSTELFYTAISTESYSKTVHEAYTTLIPILIKHSVTTSNPELNTNDDIQNTESIDTQTAYDTTDITFFDNEYEVANNLARPEILSAKTNTLSEALVMERNENNLKSEPINITENYNLENTSIFIEATTSFDESLSSAILDIMNVTTKIPFTKHTLPLKLEKDILQKELKTEDTVSLNDNFVITTYSGIEGIHDAISRNVSKAMPQEELVKNKLFHKKVIMVSNTSLEDSHTLKKNLSSKHSLSAKLNEKDPFQKKSEIEVTIAFQSTFETSTNPEMKRTSDELSENKIKVPKNDSESLAQEESAVNKLLDEEVSLLFHTSLEENFTSKRNFSNINLDTHTETVQKIDNNGLKSLWNQNDSSIIESISSYVRSTEITTVDLPEFTREYIKIIANISADDLLAENNATLNNKEIRTMSESGTKPPSTDTFTVALNSTIFFTKELSATVDMEVTTMGIIAQQNQTDESVTMPTPIIDVGSSLDSIAQSTFKHKDMKKVSVPGSRTKIHENIFGLITDELISSPTHTETTNKDESRNEDSDYFGNHGTTLMLGNDSSTKNIAVNDSLENIQEKRMPDPSTSAITTITTERSTLETLILKNVSSSQTIIQNNKEAITTESNPGNIDTNNDTNVENIIYSSSFTPESVISDLILTTPATLSLTEVMQDTTINKQLTTSDIRIKESTSFNIESVISDLRVSTSSPLSSTEIVQNTTINKYLITSDMRTKESSLFTTESVNSDLRVSTPAPLSSMEVMQNTTKCKQLTKSDMNIKQIIESPYKGTTQHTFIEALQTTQLYAGHNATITAPIFEAKEETKTEKLAQLNDILTRITTQQHDYTLFEEERKSSIEPTTIEIVKIQLYSDKSRVTPVYNKTESIINARIENPSTESFSFGSHTQKSSIVNKPFTSDDIESKKISPKSISMFTQANKNYTKKANDKRSKNLKRKIKTKKPIAFELNIRIGVEANKDGIKFSVLDEKETVRHEKKELRLPETIHFNLNQSADNDFQDTLLRSELKFPNESVNNNTTSLRNTIKDIDLNKMARRSPNVTNEDLSRITDILKKLSWNPPAKTQRRRKFPKHTKTRKSFAGNTTMNEEIQLDQVNTTSYNATTTSTNKNFTSIKHKSIMPGALTEQHAITNITSIYKEHFDKLKVFMNYTKNGNKSATDVLKKTNEAILSFPVTGNIEKTRLYTSGVNNTLQEDQEDLEVGSRTLGRAKNNSVKSDPTLNKNETSKTSKLINKKIEIMLKKLLKGKKLSKRQLRKFKRKLLEKLTSKKNITNIHKFHATIKKKNAVNMTTTVTLTTTNKYTTIQADNVTGIPNVKVNTSSSSYSEKPNTKIVSIENNETQSEEKIRKGIDKQTAAVAILDITSDSILQGGRRRFDTHSTKSLLSHEIEQESSKFRPETTYKNTSTETNISFSKVAAITSNEEAHLSEMIHQKIDEDISKSENELIEVILNSSDALSKTEIKKETLSLFDSYYSDLMEELNVALTQKNNNKTLSYTDVNSTSTIVTDAKNTTVISDTKSDNSANRYEMDEKNITAPFQTTVGFDGTTPFLITKIESDGQNKFSSDKEDSKYSGPMTTVKSNTFDNSKVQSDDNATKVTFPLMYEPNDNITKTKHKVITNIRETKHNLKDILDEIPDQTTKSSEFFFKDDYRRAENLETFISTQQINDVSNTLLPPTREILSFTRRIQIFTDTNPNKYEGFETTASIASASATANNSQDIILTSPSKFDILTTYHPDAQPSIISKFQPIVTDFPSTLNKSKIKETVANKSLDIEKGRYINNGNLSVDELKYSNAKSTTNSSTIDYSSTSTLNYEELKSTDQMGSGLNTLLPEDPNSSINKNMSAEYNFTISTDTFEHITDSVESASTLDKEMYKEKQNQHKTISKGIRNNVNNDFEIIKICSNSNISMIIGQEVILCLRKKIIEELETSSTAIQDLNITTQHPMEEFFINFADVERESQHSFISTLGTEEYIETTSNIPDVSTTKLPQTQITSKILKTEQETKGHVHEIQMRNFTYYNNTTSSKNTYKQHLSTNTSDVTEKNIENLNNNQKMTKNIQSSQKTLTVNQENLLPGPTIVNGSAKNTATDSTGITLTSQFGNTSSMIPESLSGIHTRQKVLKQSIINKNVLTGVNYETFVDNVTETIKISSGSSPVTTQYIIAVTDNQFTSASLDASTHEEKTSSIEVREHEKIFEKQLKRVNKTQLFYVKDKSVNVTSSEKRNIINSSKTNSLLEDKSVNVTSAERSNIMNSSKTNSLVSLVQNRTKKIQDKTSGNNTKHHVFVKVHDSEKKVSVISTPTLSHLKVTQMNAVKKNTVNLKPEVQKLLLGSSNKTKLRTDRKNQNGINGKDNHSNYKSIFPNVGSMERKEDIRSRNINSKISKMEIFSSRQKKPHNVLPTTTAYTKNIKYNTYRPITKEELEILKYFSDPILNSVLHKLVDDEPHSQVPAFNHSNAAMESGSNISQSEYKINNSEAKQMIHAKNQDDDKNLNQSIEVTKIPHSLEINRISHPILEININSPQIRTNGNSPPMIEINGNPLPIEINRNSASMEINRNSAPMGNNGNFAPIRINGNPTPMGINGNSVPMGIHGNIAPMEMNGNSGPMGNNGNSAQISINGNSAPMGKNGNLVPKGINENSAQMDNNGNFAAIRINGNPTSIGINGNSVPMGINGNSAQMSINGNMAPMEMNGNSGPMGINGNSAQMSINRNSAPIGNTENSAKMGMNGNAALVGMNGNSAPIGIYVNSAPMAMNVNSGLMGMNGTAPMGINGNSAAMGINGNSAPMRMNGKYVPEISVNGNSFIFDIAKNSAPISGKSMIMNINRNLVPMDITNNPVAIEMNGNPMPMGNNGNSESIGTQRSPVPIGKNGNQLLKRTNGNLLSMGNSGNSVPVRMNENSVPIGIKRNSLIIDNTRNPVPKGINENLALMRTSGNSMTMNINRNPVAMEIYSIPVPIELNRNSIPLAINRSSVPKVADRKSEPLVNNENSMPMNITRDSVQMDTNSNLLPTDILGNSEPVEINRTPVSTEINKTSVPIDLNKTSVPSEINRNPVPMEGTRNQVLMDINRNSLLMELNRSSIPQQNNRKLIPQVSNNNSNSKEINRELPRILETNRNTSPTQWALNRNILSEMNLSSIVGNHLNLSPTNDKNRSPPSKDENNKNVLVDNENLFSTTNKPWISASMFNSHGNSHAKIDNNSNLPQTFQKTQNSLLTLNRNKNSPSIIDINRYSLVVNKNSPTIIHNKWNLPSIMGNNKKAPSMADNINKHAINENTKTTTASGNNKNAHSVIDHQKSSKNIVNKKNKPSGHRDQDNNKNSLSVVHLPSTMETNNKSPLLNYFNQIAHSTVKTNIISASPTTETKTSKTIVATKKKILPIKELKRKPFLTFESNKKPLSITGKNTHGPLEIKRNTHSKFVSKNFKRIGSQKETLLNSFESMNPYAAKIKEPSVQPAIKQMKIGTRRKAVKTINTQDFISQHRYVTLRSILQKTTKPYSMFLKPQRLILKSKTLRPKFDRIDKPAKRLATKMKPKLVFRKGRSGGNIQRMVPNRARVNNVLDMPIWHTTLKPKFLKDRHDAMNFVFDDEYLKIMKMTRRPGATDDLRFFGNNYNPSPSFRRNNKEQPTTASGKKRQQRRTIFFLSPTETYDLYK